jgi:hypothetical protein
MPKELSQAMIEEWVALADKQFTTKGICAEVGIDSPQGKQHLKVILNRLKGKGIIVSTGQDGHWRKVDSTLEEIKWWESDPTAELELVFPFGLEALCKLYPKSIVIVAGEKSAGKTAFLLNFAVNNMNHPLGLDFFNSETGPEQLNARLAPFALPTPPPFKVFSRYDCFSDVVQPDRISVIDYMDMDSEVYMIGKEINDIFKKLNKGIAVIGLQKKGGSDLAYGGAFTAKRAQLYVTLGARKVKVLYAKTPRKKPVDGMAWTFKLDDTGVNFIDVREFKDAFA